MDEQRSVYVPPANWIWLAEIQRHERCLEICDLVAPGASPLARHFESVTQLNAAEAMGKGPHMPYPDEMFDCVVLGTVEHLRSMLLESRRVLRTGGCLYAQGTNRWYYGRVRARDETDTHRSGPTGSLLKHAGFREIHTYYVDPLPDVPRFIIPATRDAVLAYERNIKIRPRQIMRLLAGLGFWRLLYPGMIYLAYL